MMTLKVENVKCGGCAGTLKKALFDTYGEVEGLKKELRSLGYPLSSDELSTFQSVSTTAKSFVSCAIGKIDEKLDTNR